MFLSNSALMCKNRLPFKNGVFNFVTGALEPHSPDVPFFRRIEYDFPQYSEELEALCTDIREKVVNSIWGDSADYVMQHTARCMAGCVEDKRFVFAVGDTNAGKGVWCDLMASAFQDFVTTFTPENLLQNPSTGGDQGKLNSWLLDLHHARLSFTNELKMERGKMIDSNIIKRFASGGIL